MNRATTVLLVAGLVSIGALFAWGALSNVRQSSLSYWGRTPAGLAQSVGAYDPPPPPRLPRGAHLATASAATSAASSATTPSSASLPPMAETGIHTHITLAVNPSPLGGNYASDGQVHDVFSPSFFAIPVGKTIEVRVVNYDDMPHTFTAPAFGLDVWIPGATGHPSVTIFSFIASSTGTFVWLCAIPCDDYSMSAPGYMQGEIHVVAS